MAISPTKNPPLRRNIEVKARLHSLSGARDCAHRVATEYLGIQFQVDTYFVCSHGRLKMREIEGSDAQLIWYQREDSHLPRSSDYQIFSVHNVEELKQLLTGAYGVLGIVAKQREIFLQRFVRIHVDQVAELGNFIEFEAVLSAETGESEGQVAIRELCHEFNINSNSLLSTSYGDMKFPRNSKKFQHRPSLPNQGT
ncbi:MAG: adenylate cyclase [Planctomycetaceae bacterium]|nr:adenylate cyclase [Planctomycetaceae bacterium]